MKRVLAILMAVVMLFSFTACTIDDNDGDTASNSYDFTTGYDETKYNAPGTLPVFKEKQTISLILPDNQFVEDWNTNLQTLSLEEQLNADLVIDSLPSGEYNTKVNLMAAAGGQDYPDAILGSFADGMVENIADSGVIVPVTEYAYNKDIAPNMIEAIDRLGWDYYPYITMPDGEIYGVPTINDSLAVMYRGKMWVYKPWFEAADINIKDIHTTEDFKNALLAVVKSDPNGNGKADEVGITASGTSQRWIKYLMNAFVYAGQDKFMYVKDGKIGFAYQTEQWKEGLKYIKELYDLGLIDPLAFSQDSTSFKAMVNYDETIVTAFCDNYKSAVSVDDPRHAEYDVMPPLDSAWNDGKPLGIQKLAEPKTAFLVSLNAKDPESVFRFGDLMVSEANSIHTHWGVEGVDWLRPSDGDKAIYEALGYEPRIIEVLEWSTIQNSHWCETGPYIRQKEIAAGVVTSEDISTQVDSEAIMLYMDAVPEEDIVKLIFTEEENEITTEGLANLNTYVYEMSGKFITGIEDIDGSWEKFQDQLKTMNIDGVLECVQAAYDRMQAIG